MPIVAGVMLRRIKEKIFAETGHQDFAIGEQVIVETDSGQEAGMVCERERMVEKPREPVGRILRRLTAEDRKTIADNRTRAHDAHRSILAKIEDHELQMKLTCADYTFDRSKLFVYYTAESRVDFRELIKDLGHILKTRIQMVQIGVRDEARMIGGIGTCGRQLCCQGFLKDFSSVTIDMAKEQDLSLNTAKLSGLCGRLMCCIGYEHGFYREARRRLPPLHAKVTTAQGQGTVTAVHYLKDEVMVVFGEQAPKPVPLADITNVTIVPRVKGGNPQRPGQQAAQQNPGQRPPNGQRPPQQQNRDGRQPQNAQRPDQRRDDRRGGRPHHPQGNRPQQPGGGQPQGNRPQQTPPGGGQQNARPPQQQNGGQQGGDRRNGQQ